MSMLVAVIGALVAALLETSVLSELSLGGAKPDLVFALAVVVAMVVGFEESLAWAVVGGVLVDVLVGRPLGTTALALLIAVGVAALLTRLATAPRSVTVALAALVLTGLFQAVLLGILNVTAGIGFAAVPMEIFVAVAIVNGVVAFLAAVATRALYRRYGSLERVDW